MTPQVQQALTTIAGSLNDFINTLPLSARPGTNQYLQTNMNQIITAIPKAEPVKIEEPPVAVAKKRAPKAK